MPTSTKQLDELIGREYQHGFVTTLETDTVPRGLDEEVIRLISASKNEPEFMLEWRLKAYRHWLTMTEPHWANVHHPPIDYQDIIYYSAPKSEKDGRAAWTRSIRNCCAPTRSSASRWRSRKCSPAWRWMRCSTASRWRPPSRQSWPNSASSSAPSPKPCRSTRIWCEQYLGSVVPYTDNFFATLNSAVFTDGSFCYIPPGVRCPMELSTYFRINAKNTGQFERTLIIADEGAYVSYLEGCTAPMRDENQLHAAVVELIALEGAQIKYSTVQNWYPGDKEGKGGIYNFVTKRGDCRGDNSQDFLDAGGDRLGHHLEISERHPAGRQLGGRVLFGGADQPLPAGRHRHQDDPPRQEHQEHHRLQGHLAPATGRTPTAAWSRCCQGCRERAQLHAVRFAAAGRPLRRAHLPLHRGEESDAPASSTRPPPRASAKTSSSTARARHRAGGRGVDDRQRLLQGSVQGICRWNSPWRRRSCWASVWKAAPAE